MTGVVFFLCVGVGFFFFLFLFFWWVFFFFFLGGGGGCPLWLAVASRLRDGQHCTLSVDVSLVSTTVTTSWQQHTLCHLHFDINLHASKTTTPGHTEPELLPTTSRHKNITTLPRPALGPDLNPIEHV